jgi:hypothetical protein
MRLVTGILFGALLIATIILGSAVVRLENYRHANFIGFCADYNVRDPQQRIAREQCLDGSQTRTNWFWHLLYGIGFL